MPDIDLALLADLGKQVQQEFGGGYISFNYDGSLDPPFWVAGDKIIGCGADWSAALKEYKELLERYNNIKERMGEK